MKGILDRSFLAAGLFAAACSAAYADKAPTRVAVAHDQALAIAPEAQRAVYNVNVENEDGSELSMYAKNGRYYVLGNAGDRYVVHVSNPTANRIEAVITVDGLDVIDGESGDLRKRGYVIQPYGDLSVEGFRTSTTDVATFRFSSVGESYAERKGKGRNVGVIAVAIFEEQAAPQIIEPSPPPEYDYRRDVDDGDEDGLSDKEAPPAPTNGATTTAQNTRGGGGGHGRAPAGHAAPPPKAPAPTRTADAGKDEPAPSHADTAGAASGSGYGQGAAVRGEMQPPTDPCCTEEKRAQERPGLGTEFGESRYSSVTFTKFVRASSKPAAVAELRYNDTAGLMALGIPVQPLPDSNEIDTRETANPFPGDGHFARPPAGVR
jgi:hypothetical protein